MVASENAFEALFETLESLFLAYSFFLFILLNFEQIVTMLYLFFTFFAEAKVGTFRALISDSSDRNSFASLALHSLMNNIWLNRNDRFLSLEDLFFQAREQSIDPLVN